LAFYDFDLCSRLFIKGKKSMDDLIKQITSKVGISDEQAKGTVDMVLQFIKGKMPENMHGVIDGALGGEAGSDGGGMLDMAKGAIGGMLGGKD
jgi:hypothetical protein